MKTCENCGKQFPNFMMIDGKKRNLQRRKYCTVCSPFDEHNTRKLEDNGKICLNCGEKLKGNQTLYCSKTCKTRVLLGYEIQKGKGIERKIYLLEQAGGCCCRCGYYKNLAALQFHHLDPLTKKFRMDARNLSNRGWDSIVREYEKCIVLCANCHFEEHHPDLMDWKDESGSART